MIYGYGNPGRQDDAAGCELIRRLDNWVKVNKLTGITLDTNYQLNIEDAFVMKGHDIVVFVDATMDEKVDQMMVTKVTANAKVDFSMHAVSPAFVLNLCQVLYDHSPETYLMHIRGYEWAFLKEMTSKADRNINTALDFIKEILMLSDVWGIKDALDRPVTMKSNSL